MAGGDALTRGVVSCARVGLRSFADSVLAERFHGLGAQLSMMEDTRGNLSLTQVLTKYAEMDPHTFFSKLSKYMSSTVAGTQMTALVLLQRVLGGSDRLMSRLHTSGLVKSLVRGHQRRVR